MRSISLRRALAWSGFGIGVLSLAACPTRDISKLDNAPTSEIKDDKPVGTNRNLDILFVVDNSDSMREEQNSLATNFPKFIDVLNQIQGGLPDVHIAVVSSDVGISPMYTVEGCNGNGDDGLMQNTPRVTGCQPPNGGARYIEDISLMTGGRQRNYNGNLADVFSCIARLGTLGCGFEEHLESMKRALSATKVENAGFLRQNAYLAVIIIGDEDDCSARDFSVFNPDPALNNVNSPLGPLASFRCTEFGVTCDGHNISRSPANYQDCSPRGDSYLQHPQAYVDFLR